MACGPGSPELSKSYMDMASKLFTFTFKFTQDTTAEFDWQLRLAAAGRDDQAQAQAFAGLPRRVWGTWPTFSQTITSSASATTPALHWNEGGGRCQWERGAPGDARLTLQACRCRVSCGRRRGRSGRPQWALRMSFGACRHREVVLSLKPHTGGRQVAGRWGRGGWSSTDVAAGRGWMRRVYCKNGPRRRRSFAG